MEVSPLLLAIQSFQQDQKEMNIIEGLLANHSDINATEQVTGFNCLMMACHLITERDALKII